MTDSVQRPAHQRMGPTEISQRLSGCAEGLIRPGGQSSPAGCGIHAGNIFEIVHPGWWQHQFEFTIGWTAVHAPSIQQDGVGDEPGQIYGTHRLARRQRRAGLLKDFLLSVETGIPQPGVRSSYFHESFQAVFNLFQKLLRGGVGPLVLFGFLEIEQDRLALEESGFLVEH